jgi:hypothetical protein
MMRPHNGIQFPGIQRTVTTSEGVSLSVREYGPRHAAHTVVLLHGLCLNKDSWTIQIEHLLRQYGDSIRSRRCTTGRLSGNAASLRRAHII